MIRKKQLTTLSLLSFLLCFLAIAGALNAQVPYKAFDQSTKKGTDYSVQYYNTENGLPQNTVNDIVQSQDHYLWLATLNGLVRYDGVHFDYYKTSTHPKLPSNHIVQIAEDHKSNLWIRTANGQLAYIENEKVIPVKFKHEVSYIGKTPQKKVIIGTSNGQLYVYNYKSFSLLGEIPDVDINQIAYYNSSTIYIGTNKGLYLFNGNHFKKIEKVSDDSIHSMLRKKNGEIVVANSSQLYSIYGSEISPMPLHPVVRRRKIKKIFLDSEDKILIANNRGLCSNYNGSILNMNRTALSSDEIISYCEDQEGFMWLGTYNKGLNKLKQKTFQTYQQYEGLIGDVISSIVERKDGSILIGNNCGGINILKGDSIHHITQLDNSCVWSLLEDHEGTIWCGTNGGGIYLIKDDKNISSFVNKLNGNIIYALFQAKDKSIWIGTENGITRYKNGLLKSYDIPGHKSLQVNYITQDNKGVIWFGSNKGLGSISSQNRIELYGEEDGLPNNNVQYVYSDDHNNLWIGSYGGLTRFHKGSFFTFPTQDNVIDSNISCIIEDNLGYIWLASNLGIRAIRRAELVNFADGRTDNLSPYIFSQEDGIKNMECNGGFQSPGIITRSGYLWFSTVRGAVVTKSRPLELANQTTLNIEKIIIDGVPQNFGDSISIRYNTGSIEIHYSLPSFNNPKKLRFKYLMEGLNHPWISAGSRRVAYYNNLPPGSYTFKVQVDDFNKESIGKEFLIIVPPPFWLTWWFYFLVGVTVVGLVIFFMYLRIHGIRKVEMEKTLLHQKYAAIELKALQAQLNPHFIFNCLNSIQHFIIINDELSANKYLGKFSYLMRMFLEHSKSDFISMEDEVALLKTYIELENLRFSNSFTFTLNIQEDLPLPEIEIPSMLFQPFVENSINHGLLNLDRKGLLYLEFKIENDTLIGIIDDDGIGREKAMEYRKARDGSRKSRGFEITKDRINVFNRKNDMDITFEIIDKKDSRGNALGTKVILKIPLYKLRQDD